MTDRSPPPKKSRLSSYDLIKEESPEDDDLRNYARMIYEGEDVEFNKKFSLQKWRATFVVEELPPENPENLLRSLFGKCIDEAKSEARRNGIEPDNLGLSIGSRLLSYDIWIPVRPISENTVEATLNRFNLVAQSKSSEGNLLGEPFTVTITVVDKKKLAAARSNHLEGSGHRQLGSVQHRISRKCLIPVNNSNDSYCLFHALYLTFIHKMGDMSKQNFYNLVHRDHNRRQREVEDLMRIADIPYGLPSYNAKNYVPKIVKYWNEEGRSKLNCFKVFIFESHGEYKPAYTYGPTDFNIPIVLYFDSNHFWGVRSVASLFEKNNYCLGCLSPYKDAKHHRKDCKRLCLNCGRLGYSCCLLNSGLKFEKNCPYCCKKFVEK